MQRIMFLLTLWLSNSIGFAANFETFEDAAKRAEEKRAAQESEKKTAEKAEDPRRNWRFKPEFGRQYWLKPVKEYLSLSLEMYDRPDASGRQLLITQTESFVFVNEIENKGNRRVSDTHFYHLRFESGQEAYVAPSAIERTIGTIEPQIFERDPGLIEAERQQRIANLAKQKLEDDKAESERKEASDRDAAKRSAARKAAEQVEAQQLAAQRAKPGPQIGMSQQQVINGTNWGRPLRVNKTIYQNGVKEQWIYGESHYLYFENGILTVIQVSR